MNINPEYNEPEFQLDAEIAMASCMEGIATSLIEPAMEKGIAWHYRGDPQDDC